MKISETYSHLSAEEKLKSKEKAYSEIQHVLTDRSILFGRKGPREIKSIVSEKLNTLGWADKVPLSKSKLTINFMREKIGICFQLGNVARTYADLLKLELLGKKNVIEIGVIIVPTKIESKKLGMNYAQFERLAKEVRHFSEILNLPIFIIGLSN
jgi:hypothetical protein